MRAREIARRKVLALGSVQPTEAGFPARNLMREQTSADGNLTGMAVIKGKELPEIQLVQLYSGVHFNSLISK